MKRIHLGLAVGAGALVASVSWLRTGAAAAQRDVGAVPPAATAEAPLAGVDLARVVAADLLARRPDWQRILELGVHLSTLLDPTRASIENGSRARIQLAGGVGVLVVERYPSGKTQCQFQLPLELAPELRALGLAGDAELALAFVFDADGRLCTSTTLAQNLLDHDPRAAEVLKGGRRVGAVHTVASGGTEWSEIVHRVSESNRWKSVIGAPQRLPADSLADPLCLHLGDLLWELARGYPLTPVTVARAADK